MGKRNGLAVFALLLSLGGLGLGLYSVFILPNTIIAQTKNNSEIIQIWTVQHPTSYYTSGSYTDIPDMDITITVNTGEDVSFVFNGEFTASVGVLIGGIRLMIDNVEMPNSKREFNIETSGGVLMGNSITSSVVLHNLAAGQYEIEVQAFGVGTNDRISKSLLVITTFI